MSRFSPSIASFCSVVSSKSNRAMFSRIRLGVTERGEDDEVVLQVPAQDHLGRRTPDLLGDVGDQRVADVVIAAQRAPGLGEDAVLVVEGAQVRAGVAGMHLDLVHRRNHRPASSTSVR